MCLPIMPQKPNLLPLSFGGFDFVGSFLEMGASLSDSLLSDILRLVFDLVGLAFSTDGGLSAFLAVS